MKIGVALGTGLLAGTAIGWLLFAAQGLGAGARGLTVDRRLRIRS